MITSYSSPEIRVGNDSYAIYTGFNLLRDDWDTTSKQILLSFMDDEPIDRLELISPLVQQVMELMNG